MATKKFKNTVSFEDKIVLPKEISGRVLVINQDGELGSSNVTQTEISYLEGLTANLQDKLDTIEEDLSTVTAEAEAAIPLTQKGASNGVATLDENGKVPTTQLPSYVDDVLEFSNLAALPAEGEAGKIYVTLDNNKTYRWSGSAYIEISPSEVNSVNTKTGIVVLSSEDLNHTQSDETKWTVVDESSIAAHLNELASRTTLLESSAPIPEGDIGQTEFNFSNNVTTPSNITGLTFSNSQVRSFVAEVTVERGLSAEAYIIQGININGSFSISQEGIGDDVGVTLSMTSSGQMQYVSTDAVEGGVIKFRARSITI